MKLLKSGTKILFVGLCLAVFSLMPQTAWAQDSINIDEMTLDMPIKRGQQVKALTILEKWGAKLGHVIVADKQLNGVVINFLTIETKLSWKIFKQVLSMNGVVVVEEAVSPGRLLIRVHMLRNVRAKEVAPYPLIEPKDIPTREEIITTIIAVKHGAAFDIFQALRSLKRRDRRQVGGIFHVKGPELIIIADFAPAVNYYEKIIRSLDVAGTNQSISIRSLRWSVASELAQVLQQIVQPQGQTGRTGGARRAAVPGRPVAPTPSTGGSGQTPQAQVIAHDPTNKLIIRAFDYQIEEIDKLITELDVRVRAPGPKFHVYKCKDADAEELAGKLNELFTGAAPTTNTNRLNSGSSSFGTNNNSGFGNNNRNTTTNRNSTFGNTNNNRNSTFGNNNRNTNNRNTNTRRNTGGIGGAGSNALDVRIIPDELTNSILVQAEEEDYIVVLQLMRQLDKKKRRVLIEAEVWEISANDDLLISTELASTQNTAQDSIRPLAVSSFGASQVSLDQTGTRFARGPGSVGVDANGNPTINLAGGLTALVTRDEIDNIPILLNTLQGYSKARQITTPFTLTNDNEEATFRVNDRQPFQTTTVNNVASQQNVQFVDAESTLTVIPTVNNDDSLTLQVNLIISSFGLRTDPNLPPPTNSREYQGTVTVPNGKFVIFGGLDSESTSFTESKFPLLGDIPYLGHLFKSWRRNKSFNKLYIFIRPVIFSNGQFRQDIEASQALLKKAHIEAKQERWVPTVIPSRLKRNDSDLQDKAFELFGTGSANPFRRAP
ncbi:MAG: secretin N-terminal domain-containing protein [Planctomycetota bacterium]|nr:secretin N-terminal domain-containing protein [Planctomycetota bacterium]